VIAGVFNTLVTTFQAFFSRSFWFGSFLPVATFVGINLVMTSLAFPEKFPLSSWAEDLDKLSYFPTVMAALIVLAYVLRPFVPLLRGMLDGSFLPEWLHDQLRLPRLQEAEAIRSEVKTAWNLRAYYQEDRALIVSRLASARVVGLGTGQAANLNAIMAAEQSVDELQRLLRSDTLPDAARVENTAQILANALSANAAKLEATHADAANARRLHAAHASMLKFLRDAQVESAYLHTIISARHSQLKLVSPEATRVGDARALAERYPLAVYNAEFDYLWPRLHLVIGDDKTDRFAARISDAESQIDFAVLSLGLCFSLFAWLPVLAVQQRLVAFLGFATALPIVVRFLYELVVQSQFAFGEVVMTAIDKYRHAVLTELNLRTPPSLAAEQALWRRLSSAEGSDLPYLKNEAKAG